MLMGIDFHFKIKSLITLTFEFTLKIHARGRSHTNPMYVQIYEPTHPLTHYTYIAFELKK